MQPIQKKMKEQIAKDHFMLKCVWTGETTNITWEHCWIYAGKQINETWAIVPLAKRFNTSHPPQIVKEYCRWISLMRATKKDLAKYPKKDWDQEKKYLDNKFIYNK